MKKFSHSLLSLVLGATGLAGILAVSSPAEVAHAVRVESTTVTFTGAISNFTVPADVTSIRVVAKGAGGGEGGVLVAGKGGSVTFDVSVIPGDVLRFKVGGVGRNAQNLSNAGGWPDGGYGVNIPGEFGGGGGGSTHVYKMNASTPVLLAIAGAGGGGTDSGEAGNGGTPSSGSQFGSPGAYLPSRNAGGASITQGGNGGCVDDFADGLCGTDGSFGLGGNAHPTEGGGGGGGGYFGGGGGIVGVAGGGGSSWWDSSKISNESQASGANSGNGSVVLSYNVAELIDSTYSIQWNSNGKIALSVFSIGSGPRVNGTYALYDSATITGTPIASVTVDGYGENAEGTSLRTLNANTRFAVKFTSGNASYSNQSWENLSLQCGTGSYNATNGFIPCTVASVGYFVPFSKSTTQVPAPAGKYISATGQMAARNCPAGEYQPSTAQSSCIPAEIGYYVPVESEVSQTACPSGFTTYSTRSLLCVSSSTQSPIFNSPSGGSSWKIGTLNPTLSYVLPETPLSNSVKMRWTLSTDATTYRELILTDTGGAVSLGALDPLAADSVFTSLSQVAGVSTKVANATSTGRLPNGLYTFTLRYQNINAGSVASISSADVALREACAAGLTSADGFTPCAAPVVTPPTTVPALQSVTQLTPGTSTPSNCTVKKGKTISKTCLATNAQISLASSSKVVITVASSSSKICKVSGSSVKTLKTGTCSTTMKVTPKKGKAKSYKVKVVVTA